jgi:threonine/homoserine/homoserine lactone efflux protein
MLNGAVRSFLFGITLAAAVGPIALLIVNYGLRNGLRAAMAAGFGAAFADLVYALVAFWVGSILLTTLAGHERALRAAAAIVLAAVGLWLMARAARPASDSVSSRTRADTSRPLATTFLLTLVNPLTIVVFTTFATQLPVGTAGTATVLFAVSLFFGSLIVQMAFAIGGATLGRFVSDPRWIRALNSASGAAIAAFGVVGLMEM